MRLLDRGAVEVIVTGCAGMTGLQSIVREAAIHSHGLRRGCDVVIVDGLKAGIGLLEQMVRNRRMFLQVHIICS